jgi:hypothetical protein
LFLGGHFAPATTGHFGSATGGHFAPAKGGQFTLKVGGHFHRFFQLWDTKVPQTRCLILE